MDNLNDILLRIGKYATPAFLILVFLFPDFCFAQGLGIGVAHPTSMLQVNGPIRTGLASGTNGVLIFNNSTNSNAVTIKTGITSGNYTLVRPAAQGGASTLLQDDGGGNLSWVSYATAGAVPSG